MAVIGITSICVTSFKMWLAWSNYFIKTITFFSSFIYLLLCGKKRVHGIGAFSINRSFDGSQPHLLSSNIRQEEGFLGLEESILEVVYFQEIVFKDSDEGPFWLPKEDKDTKQLTTRWKSIVQRGKLHPQKLIRPSQSGSTQKGRIKHNWCNLPRII